MSYKYNSELNPKMNVLMYFNETGNTWTSLYEVVDGIQSIKYNTAAQILSASYKNGELTRRGKHGHLEYKLIQKGTETLKQTGRKQTQSETITHNVFDNEVLNVLSAFGDKEFTARQVHDEINKNTTVSAIAASLQRLIKCKKVKTSDSTDRYNGKVNRYLLVYNSTVESTINNNKEQNTEKNGDRIKHIINYLNKAGGWRAPIAVTKYLGLNHKTHSGGIGGILSRMYESNQIEQKVENGIRYYRLISTQNKEVSNPLTEPKEQNDEYKPKAHTPTNKQYTVVPKVATQPSDYILMLRGRVQCLGLNGIEDSTIAQICFGALQNEYDTIKQRRETERFNIKQKEEMKYLEDNKFIILDEYKKQQNEIQDLKDKLDLIDTKEMKDRTMSEHLTKNEIKR